MPRIPRYFIDTSFFHIMCQGINKEYIFNEKKDKITYKRLIKKYTKENIKIIAYCIMDNHVHLLIYAESIPKLTSFMHKINTIYGLYYNKEYNRVGYVFRDRFKSEPIMSEIYLRQCIDYIHLNPVEAKICINPNQYEYSSYNEYLGKKYIIAEDVMKLVFGSENYKYMLHNVSLPFLEDEDNKTKCKRLVKEFIKEKHSTLEKLIQDQDTLKKLIVKLKVDNGISYRIIESEIGLKKDLIRRRLKN